ncbi:MAG: hypothetical protein LC733_12785 [Actinobacteria bacterium]|nr:hypothetical protein [Actinomycetota bacterium]
MSLATAVAAPLALLAVLWSMVGDRPATGMPFGRVLALQWTALLFQESTESLVAGHPFTAMLSSRPLWLALAAQLVVAAGAVVLLRSACAVGARLVSRSRLSPLIVTASASAPLRPVAASPRWRPRLTLPARAPPLIVAG